MLDEASKFSVAGLATVREPISRLRLNYGESNYLLRLNYGESNYLLRLNYGEFSYLLHLNYGESSD